MPLKKSIKMLHPKQKEAITLWSEYGDKPEGCNINTFKTNKRTALNNLKKQLTDIYK